MTTQDETMALVRRMRKVRKLARMYPVESIQDRFDAIGQIVSREPAPKKAEPKVESEPKPAPARQAKPGLDRMDRGGQTRGGGDAA